MKDVAESDSQLWRCRAATSGDLTALVDLEQRCFSIDRLSRRQFKWMLQKANSDLILADSDQGLIGYVLLLFHRGTSLARLYSLAVDQSARSTGLADCLMKEAENAARRRHCIYLRLEVHLENHKAIKLYTRHDYYQFGRLADYYEDHSDALRFEKRIHNLPEDVPHNVPFYQQSMDFTCGPASLIMAMQALNPDFPADRILEAQLWREATTIFMTSGHGGCSPQGLALAAWRRDFTVELIINQKEPYFLEGVRKPNKKEVMRLVHEDFVRQIKESDIKITRRALRAIQLIKKIKSGGIPLVLISSYRFNRSKAPHWVVVAAADAHYVYLHDPDVDADEHRTAADNMYVPVSHEQFDRMTHFGQSRSQAAVVISRSANPVNQGGG